MKPNRTTAALRKLAPYLLLITLASGAAYATVELMPNPGTQHAAPAAPAPDRSAEPTARPATPAPATGTLLSASEPQLGTPAPADAPSDYEGTDAGLVTEPAPQVTPLPGGVTPAPEAPRPTEDPVEPPVEQTGPACLQTCPPVADDSGVGQLICPDGTEYQGEFGCVATQLPGETTGRATD